MKKTVLIVLVSFCLGLISASAQNPTPVELHGQLSVKGNRIVDKNGEAVQLRGMSLFWSQWQGSFYNKALVKWLKNDWCITVIRAAMAADSANEGYAYHPSIAAEEKEKVIAVVDAAIELGIYVIIDYHSHNAHFKKNKAAAKVFFAEMSAKYKDVPNVIYEPWNEPIFNSNPNAWDATIKPYHEEIIEIIRTNDPNNIIVCGTRQWSQRVDEAAENPIKKPNIAYTLHYYANSHKGELREIADYALSNNIALFVTEYGTCNASGNLGFNAAESKTWWDFLNANKIGYCNWSVADKAETASIMKPGSSSTGGWALTNLTESGKLVRENLLQNCAVTSGIEDELNAGKSVLYPNPFQNKITIKRNGTFNYAIIDANGIELSKGNATETAQFGEELPNGIYMIKIEQNEKIDFQKAIKSN